MNDYRKALLSKHRAEKHVHDICKRIETLSAKTLNEYLFSVNAFIHWTEKLGYIDKNPLKYIEKVETRGHERKKRRAWTDDEFDKFMSVPPQYREDYRSAIFLMRWTGLRVKEVQTLAWGDVFLNVQKPYIVIRAQRSKNHKEESLPLLRCVTDFLNHLRSIDCDTSTRIIDYKIPASEQFKRDQKRLGIQYRTELGDLYRI